jgi:diacylglycerol kinase (ATP)
MNRTTLRPARSGDRVLPPSGSIQIVATSGAGRGEAQETAAQLRAGLQARGREAALHLFDGLDELHAWARSSAGLPLVVAVGGDATLSAAAEAAVRHAAPFLPIPCGFGNLFTRELGHTPEVEHALELVERGRLVDLDVGLRNGELFLCQESFGFLHDVQHRVEAKGAQPRAPWRRWLGYVRAAVRQLRDTPLRTFRVAVDGRTVARKAALVTVANVKTYGSWLPLTPDASPVDGLFDVFVMKAARKRALLAELLRRCAGMVARGPGIDLYRGRRVTVTSAADRHHLVLLPGRLPVVVPEETAAALLAPRDRIPARRRGAIRVA